MRCVVWHLKKTNKQNKNKKKKKTPLEPYFDLEMDEFYCPKRKRREKYFKIVMFSHFIVYLVGEKSTAKYRIVVHILMNCISYSLNTLYTDGRLTLG